MSELPGLLAHRNGDDVAVAVRDLEAGSTSVAFLDTASTTLAPVSESIPLGHKVALRDLAAGAEVIEYGVPIGVLTQPVSAGSLVHVHNLRSARWSARD
ncbi:MAG: UxaA family hydrolase [Acidimicrobiales bacterium]